MMKNKNLCIGRIIQYLGSDYDYKNSNIEWMKSIPKDWNLVPLKFVAKFIGGGTPSKANSEYWIGKIPWVSPKDMKSEVLVDSEDHITEEAVENSSTSLIPSDTVLLVVRSGILRHSIPVAINAIPVALNQDMKALIPLRSLEAAYLKYFISGNQNALLFDWRKEGATVESIEHELLANTKILIPSIVEQRAIISFLERETAKIDALIAKKERLIELLQEKRSALISHAVTKGLDPRAPMKDSGVEWLGEIPEHWKVKQLKRLAGLRAGYAITSDIIEEVGEYPVFGGNGIRGFTSSYTHEGEFPLIGRQGALCGCVNFAHGRFWASEHAVVVTPKPEVNPCWLTHLLGAMSLNAYSESAAQPGLGVETISSIPVPILFIAEQRAIAAFLDRETAKIDALRSKIQNTIEKLKEYRTALISAAVTGKINVRDEAGVVA